LWSDSTEHISTRIITILKTLTGPLRHYFYARRAALQD
jgi:hypothetical protein